VSEPPDRLVAGAGWMLDVVIDRLGEPVSS